MIGYPSRQAAYWAERGRAARIGIAYEDSGAEARLRAAMRPPGMTAAWASGQTCRMTGKHRGVVKFWRAEKGWGAISSEDLPVGRDAWAHFSVVDMGDRHVYVELTAGQPVEFAYEVAKQDSFDFRATWVRPLV